MTKNSFVAEVTFKNLRKQIMIRSHLKSKINKSKDPIDIAKFNQQQNLG